MKILSSIVLYLTFILAELSLALDIDDIALSNCGDGSFCNETSDTVLDVPVTIVNTKTVTTASSVTSQNTKDVDNATTQISQTTKKSTNPPVTTARSNDITSTTMINNFKEETSFIGKHYSDICTCDITISSCDVNCCCDIDCNESQVSLFSHCDDHRPKMYDSRYCYTKNFIQRNRTRYILDRLASNLFCIAYDNLPPVYGISDVPDIKNRKSFEDAKRAINVNKYTWDWKNLVMPTAFNISSRYHVTDDLWKLRANVLSLMELRQSGLTGECKFGKTFKYLKPSKWTCMQTNLSNDNSYLFFAIYNNLTVISSPHLFNASYISGNNSCPKNVCLPVQSVYCSNAGDLCNNTQPPTQKCSNVYCENIVKRINYKIILNGTFGIQSIEARFQLTNTSKTFYQHFQVTYEWSPDSTVGLLPSQLLLRSGNPGYNIGNPIIIGSLVTNGTTNDPMNKNVMINVSRSNYYLTMPLSKPNGDCDSHERYTVNFGKNARLRCNVQLKTNNFTSESCMNLQNQTLKFLMRDVSLQNIVTDIDKYKIAFISKTGDIVTNDTSNWIQILLDGIPQNVVTGQINNNAIVCSGIVRSLHVEILHTILPKPENADNYKIAGVSFTFSEPIDVYMPKCLEDNCTDVLKVELLTFVSFIDISTPSMYYYAGGPNLDITLPYDFFYPFMGSGMNFEPSINFVLSTFIIIYYIS